MKVPAPRPFMLALMKCQLLKLCRDTSQKTGKAIQPGFPVPRDGWLDYSVWCQSLSWRTVSLFLGPFLDWEKQSHHTAQQPVPDRVYTPAPCSYVPQDKCGGGSCVPTSVLASYLSSQDRLVGFSPNWDLQFVNIPLYTFPNFMNRIK